MLQLRLLGLEHSKLDFDGTSLLLEGKALMTLDNIPVMFNSKNFSAMKDEYTVLEKEYWELREKVRKDPDDENALTEYLNISGRKNSIGEAMHGLQRDIIAMETSFLEKVGSGYISPRLIQARLLFESGDLESARKLFDLEQMMREDERDEELLEETQKKIQAKVSEYLYLADMIKTDVNNPDRFAEIEKIYEQAVRIGEKHNLSDNTAAWKYVDYLYYQNEYEKAAEFANRQLYLLEADKTEEAEIANFSHFVSRCYNRLHNYDDAEKMSQKALEIRERLAAEDPAAFDPEVAAGYIYMSKVYDKTKNWAQGEIILTKALAITERLAVTHPDAYEYMLLPNLSNLARVYEANLNYPQAEAMYKRALETSINPTSGESNQGYTAIISYNLASLLEKMEKLDESEELHKRSLDLYEQLAIAITATYEPDLAKGYNGLAGLYKRTGRLSEAKELYKKALEIRKRLAAENPEVFTEDLEQTKSDMAGL